MIWLLPHLLPISLSKLDRRHRKTEKERQLPGGRWRREEVGEEPNHTTARKPGSL
jgi:hypothetical protein